MACFLTRLEVLNSVRQLVNEIVEGSKVNDPAVLLASTLRWPGCTGWPSQPFWSGIGKISADFWFRNLVRCGRIDDALVALWLYVRWELILSHGGRIGQQKEMESYMLCACCCSNVLGYWRSVPGAVCFRRGGRCLYAGRGILHFS